MSKSETPTPHTRNKSATKTAKSRRKSSPKTGNENESVTETSPVRFAFVPILREFRGHTKKNEARLWIPVTTSLLTRYEFASCSLQTRYVFVAIVLYCGGNGIEEIPLDSTFLSSVLVADYRTVEKSLEELLAKELLILRLEREKEREEKTETDRQTSANSRDASVSVSDLNLSENENEEKEFDQKNHLRAVPKLNGSHSKFSIEEINKYVEMCVVKGDSIQNPRALAQSLFNSGTSDGTIQAMLYPQSVKEIEREMFGEPRLFTDAPCSVCYGAKQSDPDGRGYRPCVHCKNEKGQPTGYEPKGEK